MIDTLEELTAETLSREKIERRLDDWLRRIEALFTQIATWAEPDWTAVSPRRTVLMDEEPMREVGLDPIRLPVLDLYRKGGGAVSVEPRGLWIIGANGRLDVLRQGAGIVGHMLVDDAEHFEPPHWCVVSLEERSKRVPLDKTILLSIL